MWIGRNDEEITKKHQKIIKKLLQKIWKRLKSTSVVFIYWLIIILKEKKVG